MVSGVCLMSPGLGRDVPGLPTSLCSLLTIVARSPGHGLWSPGVSVLGPCQMKAVGMGCSRRGFGVFWGLGGVCVPGFHPQLQRSRRRVLVPCQQLPRLGGAEGLPRMGLSWSVPKMRSGQGPFSAATTSSMCPKIQAWVPLGRAVRSPKTSPLGLDLPLQGWISGGGCWPWTCPTGPQEEAVFCFSTHFLL